MTNITSPYSVSSPYIRTISKDFLGRWKKRVLRRGGDFVKLRGYVSGDAPRDIDRKATARQQEMQVKHTQDLSLDVRFVLDEMTRNRSMQKAHAMQEIVYAIGRAACSGGERVGAVAGESIVPLGRKRETLEKICGKISQSHSSFREVCSWLLWGDSSEDKGEETLEHRLQHLLSLNIKPAMIVICTDAIDIDLTLLEQLSHKHTICFIHLWDDLESGGVDKKKAAYVTYVSPGGQQRMLKRNSPERCARQADIVAGVPLQWQSRLASLQGVYAHVNTTSCVTKQFVDQVMS